jgi:glucose-1-phosphate cytidylyltransferase
MTYGDGLSNVNIKKLLNFHIKNKKIATMTIVRPVARFGHIKLKKNLIVEFKEKDQISEGWINGGFFVLNTEIFRYLNSKEDLIFERKPLEQLSKKNQLAAFKHESFWHPMDTLRDKRYLEKISINNKPPWLID